MPIHKALWSDSWRQRGNSHLGQLGFWRTSRFPALIHTYRGNSKGQRRYKEVHIQQMHKVLVSSPDYSAMLLQVRRDLLNNNEREGNRTTDRRAKQQGDHIQAKGQNIIITNQQLHNEVRRITRTPTCVKSSGKCGFYFQTIIVCSYFTTRSQFCIRVRQHKKIL